VGVRIGASDNVDVLAEIGNLGVGFGVKAAYMPEDSSVAIAFAPRVNAGTVILFSSLQATLPLLIGLQLGDHELTLGPRVDVLRGSFISSSSARASVWLAGGTAGLAVQAGPLRITPELGFARAFRGSVSFLDEGESGSIDGGWLLQPNLFVAFEVGGED